MMAESKEIGLKVKYIRERKGLSQKDLAKSLRISGGYLSQLELGERNIDASLLYRIAVELKTPIEHFYPDTPASEIQCGTELIRFVHAGKTLCICEV